MDFVADALFVLKNKIGPSAPSGEIFHLVAGENAVPLLKGLEKGAKSLVDCLTRHGHPAPLCLVGEEEVTEAHASEIMKKMTQEERDLLYMADRYLPYGTDRFVYSNQRLLSALQGTGVVPLSAPDFSDLLIDYFVRTDFGKHPEPRPALGRMPGGQRNRS